MASSHDAAFGGAALKQRILTSEQLILGEKVQKILGDLGIPKPFAVIAVEAGWIELDQALAIVTGLRKMGLDHPEVKPREASEADETVLERLSPAARKKLENASRTLASLFYARGAGTLALDQGAAPPTPTRGGRKPGDPAPTPAPARRVKPVVVAPGPPPPRKNNALGAIIAVAAALVAIVGLIVVKQGKTPPAPEPEPPPPVVKRVPPTPKPPVAPPPTAPPPAPPDDSDTDIKPDEPSTDPAVEAKRKQYIEEREREAERLFGEIKELLAEGRPASARGKLRQLSKEFGWTEFVKLRGDEIARLLKETEAEPSSGIPDEPSGPPEPVAEGPALPGVAAALKRLDEGASADARRAAGAKARLAGTKTDLLLRGGKVVKGAEIVDLTREDLRVRGEIDGEKVDLLLAWTALDAPSFLSIQKQIAKSQGAAGLFEMGRACIQRRLWKDAKAAFDECAKVDPAWKPRLPDIAAVLADTAILRGARRLADRRLLVDYSFGDAEQSADFAPLSGTGGTLAVAGGALKVAGKETVLWSLKDVEFEGDIVIDFEFEGPGEAAIGFAAAGEGQRSIFYFASGKSRFDEAKAGSPDSGLPFQQAAAQGAPVRIERLGSILRVRQGDRVLSSAVGAGWTGPRRLILGARGEAAFRNLSVSGTVGAGEMTKRLGPLERLEGGAHAGDFRLEPAAADAEAASRASLAEAALEVGQLEEAWTLADEAVTRSPADGLAVAIRGLIRLAQGETRLAVADADLALALDPCRGEVAIRARRILSALRGPLAAGAFRRQEIGPWDLRTDGNAERLKHFAGKLDEAGKRFAEALKDAGPAPKAVRAAVFASRDAWLAYSESSQGREAAIVDSPGAEKELVRLAALSYLRAAVAAAPAWFEEGMAAHLAGEAASAEMKLLLPQAAPLDALLKKSASDFAETDRLQSASFVRFLLAGAHKGIIPDLLKKLKHGVPAIEAFSGKSIPNLDAEWRKWAAADGGN